MSFFRKLANWYFRKNALPYWSIFLLDGVILLLSGFISYWIFTSWIEATEDIVPLMCTLAVYVLLSLCAAEYLRYPYLPYVCRCGTFLVV